jgi:hypothetical protein
MIRIAITAEAFAAIEATLPLGTVAVEPKANEKGKREIWLDEWGAQPAAPHARPRRELQRRDLAARRDRGADALRTLPIAPLFG